MKKMAFICVMIMFLYCNATAESSGRQSLTSTIHLADKAGHFIMLDEPEWLCQEVGSFSLKK